MRNVCISLGYQAASALLEAGLVVDEGDLFALSADDLRRATKVVARTLLDLLKA